MTPAGGAEAGRGATLLALARAAVAEALAGDGVEPPEENWLDEPGATFVTLELAGELRGCIGSITPRRPLGEDVRENALAAAFRDPRFPPVTAPELPRLRFAVSLLSPVEQVICIDEADLARRLRPGVDGLVLEYAGHRGTFLPAVWRHYPEPAEFLRQLKRKAGLDPDFWAPEVVVGRYTVDSWAEEAG